MFDDPYSIRVAFPSDTFVGDDRQKDIHSDDDPCSSPHDRGDTKTYAVSEQHAPIDVEGHPDKHPKNVHMLTGKDITLDSIPNSNEKGTATTTITWRLRYCEMASDLAPLAPMTC